ncbi:alpha/beta fold hydrolase [Corynebacterium sp. A21]|uniref:alpha/beta fold hydrolase n=1 Tax=Corynebacterium sp. A21 TaxID=3457318 RepID=UPI003FD251AE
MTSTIIPTDITRESTSRTVQTKDWNIHYQEVGTGYPVILIHGSGPGAGGWSNFSPNIIPLAQHFRVLAIDVPGWGKSSAVRAQESDSVEALRQFMDELGIEKAALIGNSMGGMIGINMAITHPERVSHLISMGAPGLARPQLFSAGGLSEGMKILVEGYKNPTKEVMRELADIMTFDPAFASEEMVAQRAEAAAERDDHRANFLEGFGKPDGFLRFSEAKDIATITAPSLLIHGRDDRVVHFENSLQLNTLIPNSRLYLINQCGHWAQLEHSEEFNRIVANFIGID